MEAINMDSLQQAIDEYIKNQYSRYHTPGHIGGEGSPAISLLGEQVFKADLTELPGLDDLHAPENVIKNAQSRAAQVFGADFTHFLVNGSSAGIIAMILAMVEPGKKLAVPRNAHRSVYHGLILSGAIPEYIPVEVPKESPVAFNISPDELNNTISTNIDSSKTPEAVLITNPSYHGVAIDMNKVALDSNIPLLVDEAHGAHFIFSKDLPPDASEYGGDLWVQSTHKTLGSLTQSSMLHGIENLVSREKLAFMLQLVQTTSPSYPLMASLESVIEYADKYHKHWQEFISNRLKYIRNKICEIPGLQLVTPEQITTGFKLDPSKLTIDLRELNISGYKLSDLLRNEFGIQVELVDSNSIMLMLTPYHTERELDYLINSLETIVNNKNSYQIVNNTVDKQLVAKTDIPYPQVEITPREAVYQEGEYIELSEAIGRVAQEFVIPYPPGIPALVPGEIITGDVYEYLNKLTENPEIHIQGFYYSSSSYIKVIR